MELTLDTLFFIARVILIAYSLLGLMLLVTGTTRTYAEWSKGFGGFLYIAGVCLDLLGLEYVIPGRDLSRVTSAVGLAFVVLPPTLQLLAPRLYVRLMEKC